MQTDPSIAVPLGPCSQFKRNGPHMASFIRVLSVVLCLAFAGCAGPTVVVTDSQTEARRSAEEAQRTADEYRRAEATGAATQAQQRADQYQTSASRKPDSILERLIDVLFNSWLASAASETTAKR